MAEKQPVTRSAVAAGPVTADQLLVMGEGFRELIRGEVVELSPAGGRHGDVGGDLFPAGR